MKQQTIRSLVSCEGIGVHSGLPIKLEIMPAPANTGIVFERADLSGPHTRISATWDKVSDTQMCTKIDNGNGASISTIEHIMAALFACAVDNCIVRVHGPEVPIMDGSAAPFIFLMECAGYTTQDAPRQFIRIKKEVRVHVDENRWVSLTPNDKDTLSIDFDFDFAGRGNVPLQSAHFSGNAEQFKSAFSFARTFGFVSDLEKLQAMGLAKGSSLDNSVGLQNGEILAKNGLRYQDEFVRHKILDCVGDLYTARLPILGHISTFNSGHHMNNLILEALFAEEDAYEIVSLPAKNEIAWDTQAAIHPISAIAAIA
ncbi:UDP-3-O-acyl-N-acetylglucosamine deacetylase [Alphaproteobacteria bacterium]|nr:UDP-3-O-acyl-N-acetylglucosamine deacetylase [Alphaproteobacteria bacterium]